METGGHLEQVPGPVAGPPSPAARLPVQAQAPSMSAEPFEVGPAIWTPFWTPASLKGWAGSVTLHRLMLLTLALWYFAPPLRKAIGFDTGWPGRRKGLPKA